MAKTGNEQVMPKWSGQALRSAEKRLPAMSQMTGTNPPRAIPRFPAPDHSTRRAFVRCRLLADEVLRRREQRGLRRWQSDHNAVMLHLRSLYVS